MSADQFLRHALSKAQCRRMTLTGQSLYLKVRLLYQSLDETKPDACVVCVTSIQYLVGKLGLNEETIRND